MDNVREKAWRQTALITVAAVAVFVGMRVIPGTGSDLHYTDFHADGKSFLEFCEPGSPQFAPVDRIRSPVILRLKPGSAPVSGQSVEIGVELLTSSGKKIGEDDLIIVHTEKLHLLIIGPKLDDYHHVHPTIEGSSGSFLFTPKQDGQYKVFADFMPRATGRGLYAGAEINVSPRSYAPLDRPEANGQTPPSLVESLRFKLSIPEDGIQINRTEEIHLSVARDDGSPITLEEIMGASAHVVAFDADRSGFAHLHPLEEGIDLPADPGANERSLAFTLYLTAPGYYRLWVQVKVDGQIRFAPFVLEAKP